MQCLIVDDNPADRELIARKLRQTFGEITFIHAGGRDAFEAALAEGNFDVVLTDYALRWATGIEILRRVQQACPGIPVIMVTESGSEEVAARSMRLGLADYLLKRHLDRLPIAVHESVERARLRRENERIRRQLEISEERYRSVSELTSDYAFAYRVTPEGESVREWVTDAFYRITGYTDEEIRDRGGWWCVLHPDDRPIVRAHKERLLSGESDAVTYRVVTRNGETRWLHVVGRPVWSEAEGRVVRVFGAAQDITERRMAEEALRASEARFRAVFTRAALGIAVADPQGQLITANPALTSMLGYSLDELSRMNLRDLSHPDDISKDAKLYEELLAGKRASYEVEKRYRRSDDAVIWAKVILSRVDNGEGRPRLLVELVEDITQQRAALLALIEAEKLALTGTLAASIAHEVNNPMQAVVGCLGLAMERLQEQGCAPGALEYLNIAAQEMHRAGRIIAQLRDLNRTSRPEERRLTDLADLVEQVLTLSAGEYGGTRVDIIKEVDHELPPVLVARDRMYQVFLNLILNAHHAMPRGGELRVRVRASDDERPGVVVTIADTGVGIAPEDMRRVFQPFFSTKKDGIGLGLYASRNIVEEHGGEISLTSAQGEGTTVKVWLPAAPDAEEV